jgi:hypothetical protein
MHPISRLTLLSALSILLFNASIYAAEQPVAAKILGEETVKWQDSETGQFVFFAVLEGLYKDGVPNEVVDLVINPSRTMDNKVKHCFVFQCEICHAAYEAFATYRLRQPFQKSAGRDTFGKGLSEKITRNLKSDDAATRVFALGDMIRPWILQRVEQMKLSKEKQEELVAVLLKFKDDARTKLHKFRAEDPLYKDWMFYGSCQACEAATEIEKHSRK